MNEENDERLCERYPKIFADRMCWEFECGDGWFTLINELCRELQWNTDKNGYPQVTATQVKEKFGGLRFYYNTEDGKADYRQGKIEGAVSFAEAMSYKICEVCGGTKDVTVTKGWNKTRCTECTAKKKEES